MSFAELKAQAKAQQILGYSTMNKAQLQYALSLSPTRKSIEYGTLKELQQKAKDRNIKYAGLSKQELIDKLLKLNQKHNKPLSPSKKSKKQENLSAVIVTNTSEYSDTSIILFMNRTPSEIITTIFDEYIISDDHEKKDKIKEMKKLKNDWINHFEKGTDAPRISSSKDRKRVDSCDGELIAIEPFTSYYYNYFFIDKVNFDEEGKVEITISEH